jgi:hypothetical protein
VPRPRTLDAYMKTMTAEDRDEHDRIILERLGFDPSKERARRIDSTQVSKLAGVLPGTVTQWKMRDRRQETPYAFVPPDPTSYPRKPLYDPRLVAGWLKWSGKGFDGGREDTRGPRQEPANA